MPQEELLGRKYDDDSNQLYIQAKTSSEGLQREWDIWWGKDFGDWPSIKSQLYFFLL